MLNSRSIVHLLIIMTNHVFMQASRLPCVECWRGKGVPVGSEPFLKNQRLTGTSIIRVKQNVNKRFLWCTARFVEYNHLIYAWHQAYLSAIPLHCFRQASFPRSSFFGPVLGRVKGRFGIGCGCCWLTASSSHLTASSKQCPPRMPSKGEGVQHSALKSAVLFG